MKIILLKRILLSIVFLVIGFLNNSLLAQCSDCNDSNETLSGCGTAIENVTYDLTTIGSGDRGYYNSCGGNGDGGSPDNGELSDTISSPSTFTPTAGDEFVFVAEFNGSGTCTGVTKVTLEALDVSPGTPVGSDPTSCGGTEGFITIPSLENNTEYAVSYSDDGTPVGPTNITSNGSGNVIITGLSEGPYSSFSVTLNGCTGNQNVTVTLNDPPDPTMGSPVGSDPTSCGGTEGFITIPSLENNTDYEITYRDDGVTVGPATIMSNGSGNVVISGLNAGTYDNFLVDLNGCTDNDNADVVLSDPSGPSPGTPVGSDPTTCSGTEGSITIPGLLSSTSYMLTYNDGGSTVGPSSVSSNGAGNIVISGLDEGTYSNFIITKDGCTGTHAGNVILSDPPDPNPGNGIGSDPTTVGGSEGFITIPGLEANTNYTFTYKDDGSTVNEGSIMTNGAGNYVIAGLDAGSYTDFTFTKDNCTGVEAGPVVLADPDCSGFNPSATQQSAACNGQDNGSIIVSNLNSGDSPVTIAWNGPGSNDGSQSGVTGSTFVIPNLEGSSGGSDYDLTITDAIGCIETINNVKVFETAALTPTLGGDNTFCFDQSAQNSIFVNETFSDYDWEDNNGGNYSGKSININNPGSTPDTYTVTVTDAGNCTGTAQIIVSRNSDIVITYDAGSSQEEVTCNGDTDGSISISVSGGTGGYTYSWSPGGKSTQDVNGLGPATYTVVVTDSEGCTKSLQRTITEPSGIIPNVSPTPASCFGFSDGSINLSVSGGTPGYSFNWSNGASTEDISGLSQGLYTVTISDSKNCTVTQSVTINEPPQVNAQISLSSNVICDGDVVTLTASGGVSYNWGPDGSTAVITDTPSPPSKSYLVEVTDNDGCMNTASAAVTVNILPTPGIVVTESSGVSNNDGTLCFGNSVTLTGTGGSSYNWSAGGNNPVVYTPSVGENIYTVTVTDNNNCKAVKSEMIFVNDNPVARINANMATFIQGSPQDFSSDSETSGPDCQILECLWNFGNGDVSTVCDDPPNVTYNSGGEFDVSLFVEDECGCTDTEVLPINIFGAEDCNYTFTVNQNEPIGCVNSPLALTKIANPSPGACTLIQNKLTVTPSGSHIENETNGTITFTQPGEYTLRFEIEDDCGCDPPAGVRTIVIEDLPDAEFSKAGEVVCEGGSLDILLKRGEGTSVQINGVSENIQNDLFTLTNIRESTTLEIVNVGNFNCDNPNPTGQTTFTISVIPEFKIDEANNVGDPTCNEEQTSFIDTIPTLGGSGDIMVLQGAEFIDRIEGGVIFTKNLPPTETYEFVFQRGNICSPVSYAIEPFECFCTFEPGDMSLVDLVLCEDEGAEGSFTKGPEFNENIDNLIYALHNSSGIDGNLGQVVAVSQEPKFAFDESKMNLGGEYFISAVGYKGARDPEELVAGNLSFMGANICLSVTRGQPVRWYQVPTPEISGPLEVCINQYDVEYSVSNLNDGSTLLYDVDGDSEETNYGFSDKVFVHFGDDEIYTVKVGETLTHQDPVKQKECIGLSEIIVTTNGQRAPDKSEIIRWPGDIFVCTADNMVYNWGLINRENGFVSPQGEGKVFFAPVGFEVPTNQILFVDIKEDAASICVTRNFFNSDGPPGFILSEGEDFQVDIFPNPNTGEFRLILKSYDVGNYKIEMYNSVGQRTFAKTISKEFPRSNNFFDINGLSSGVYYIKVTSDISNTVNTQKVIVH